ncbi:dynein assembly factor 5, axonemal [Sitophilus oryzae]|uniref:Dynein assembly factor 5, axonemal n=1 Tax=Sitophilus oryzae TaxID=7048 RepID=A0A6J2XSC7_SITOR|nr:dynein assembly factor 5, axonemal [Sitophilus oryzae]
MVIQKCEEEMSQKVSESKKICLGFHSPDRKIRKQTYQELKNFLTNKENDFSADDLQKIFIENHIYFLNGLRDKSETVREEAIKFATYIIMERLPLNDFYLTYTFPILVERIGSVELIEESEEIRLQMLQFLDNIIEKYSNTEQLRPFLNDSVKIFCETVRDKYPSIKELSCQTIRKLSIALPRDFHMQAESLLKPVLSCFSHQRYKVRVEAIKTVGEIIMHSSYKGVDEAIVPMAEKLFDQIPIVRQTVAQEAARWMLYQRDRYSYFHKMLPLLLTGLNDEVESTRIEAHMLWEKVGLQYQQENEKDLKDKLDFLTEMPKHYPNHLKRPNLGCRVLVQRNISKIASAISNELTNWQEDIRVRCSQLLCSLALHAEEDLTFNLQNLLPAMYSAARDQDSRVVANIIQASEIIGLFVPFDTWSKIILPVIEDGPHHGHLVVMASLIKGAPIEYMAKGVFPISKLLSEDYICCSRKQKYQSELLKCVKALLEKYDKCNDDPGYHLFKIITSLMSLKDPNNAEELTIKLYEYLAKCLGFSDTEECLLKYSNELFIHINTSPKSWTVMTDNACIFLCLLEECQTAFGVNLDIISEILIKVLDNETDAELRLKTFYSLASVFENKDIIFQKAENLTSFLEKLIEEVFIPSLVWHAGSTAEAIRTMAATCLKCAFLPTQQVELFVSSDVLTAVAQKLQPLLLSLMEDASYKSRKVAIECVVLLKDICSNKNVWTNDDLIKVYPEVLKRLDDPTEKVRLCALSYIPKIFQDVPNEFTQEHFKGHREFVIDTLITHLDDDDETVQNLVLESFKTLARICSKELSWKIEAHRGLLRNQKGCDEIAKYIQTVP